MVDHLVDDFIPNEYTTVLFETMMIRSIMDVGKLIKYLFNKNITSKTVDRRDVKELTGEGVNDLITCLFYFSFLFSFSFSSTFSYLLLPSLLDPR